MMPSPLRSSIAASEKASKESITENIIADPAASVPGHSIEPPTIPTHPAAVNQASQPPLPPPVGQEPSHFVNASPISSIREEDSEIPQSFQSVATSVETGATQTISNSPNMAAIIVNQQPPAPPYFFCPCEALRQWKDIPIDGKRASKSFSDLRLPSHHQSVHLSWQPDAAPTETEARQKQGVRGERRPHFNLQVDNIDEEVEEPPQQQQQQQKQQQHTPSDQADFVLSTLEELYYSRPHIIEQIIRNLVIDIPPNGSHPRNLDLMSCLLTSRTMHVATVEVLYKHVTIPHSTIFSKFLAQIKRYPGLQRFVHRLDFSHFTSVGLGRTMQMNETIQNLTSRTLIDCLDRLPELREALFQEHLEGDLSSDVIYKVLTEKPKLQAADFCGCSSAPFSANFLDAITRDTVPPILPTLKRLSLHECSSLDAEVFTTLLPKLQNLTHLDVAHTLITDDALFAIPETARLTHLNLARCTKLRGDAVVRFLTTHPAACNNSLVYLNLSADAASSTLLGEDEVDVLLRYLVDEENRCFDRQHFHDTLRTEHPNLRSLSIGGARGLAQRHIPLIRTLCTWLEELGLAYSGYTIEEISQIFADETEQKQQRMDELYEGDDDAMEIDSAVSTTTDNTKQLTLRYIDLTGTPGLNHTALVNPRISAFMTEKSAPVVVVELSYYVTKPLAERQRRFPGGANMKLSSGIPSYPSRSYPPESDVALSARYGNGWVVRDLGRRNWYVRGYGAKGAKECGVPGSGCEEHHIDNGDRSWKMGAKWWGMRKVPVAVGDVGGLYGHYMFKR